eukprot:5844563-Pyramimonas_sp.AAC.1
MGERLVVVEDEGGAVPAEAGAELVEAPLDLRVGGGPKQNELSAAELGVVGGVLDQIDALLG